MPKTIDVPGHGLVEFPDDMSDDDIVKAIKANEPSTVGKVAGPVVRGAVKGALGPLPFVADTISGGADLSQFPIAAPEFGGSMSNEDVPHYPEVNTRTMSFVDKVLDRLGVPRSSSTGQRILESAAAGATGGGLYSAGVKPTIAVPAGAAAGAVGGAMGESGLPYPVQMAGEMGAAMLTGRGLAGKNGAVGTKTQLKLQQDLAKEGKLNTAEQTYRAAKGRGVDLNLAESADSARLKNAAAEAVAAKGDPNAIEDWNRTRTTQVKDAIDRFMNFVSPKGASIEGAAGDARTAAKSAQEVISAKRKAQADLYYDQVFNNRARLSKADQQEIVSLMDEPGFEKAWDAAGKAYDMKPATAPEKGYQNKFLYQLFMTKAELARHAKDYNPTGKALENMSSRDAASWADRIDGVLERISPKDANGNSLYRQATDIYSQATPRVQAAQEGPLGRLAETANEDLSKAPKKFFDPNRNPIEVANAMQDIKARSPEAAAGLKRAYLESTLDSVTNSKQNSLETSQIGANWVDALKKLPNNTRLIQAALDQKEWQAFDALTSTLRATKQFKMSPSSAQWESSAQKLGDAIPDAVVSSAGGALGWKRFVLKTYDNLVKGKANKEIAALMTDPKGVEKVLAAKRLPPVDRQLAIVSILATYSKPEPSDGSEPTP